MDLNLSPLFSSHPPSSRASALPPLMPLSPSSPQKQFHRRFATTTAASVDFIFSAMAFCRHDRFHCCSCDHCLHCYRHYPLQHHVNCYCCLQSATKTFLYTLYWVSFQRKWLHFLLLQTVIGNMKGTVWWIHEKVQQFMSDQRFNCICLRWKLNNKYKRYLINLTVMSPWDMNLKGQGLDIRTGSN